MEITCASERNRRQRANCVASLSERRNSHLRSGKRSIREISNTNYITNEVNRACKSSVIPFEFFCDRRNLEKIMLKLCDASISCVCLCVHKTLHDLNTALTLCVCME